MAVCRNCGRGYDHNMDEFDCGVCGAHNGADGSVEYDGGRVDVNRMKERIEEYDTNYQY